MEVTQPLRSKIACERKLKSYKLKLWILSKRSIAFFIPQEMSIKFLN